MVHIPYDDEDVPSDPSTGPRGPSIPFEHDDYWRECPGGMWTPELEHKYMPIRQPTPAELADTERKRGSSEDETCPVDPLLANLDFTSEYISPKEEERIFKEDLQRYHEHIKWDEDSDDLLFLDYDEEDPF